MILNVVNCIERRPHVLDKKEKVKGGGGEGKILLANSGSNRKPEARTKMLYL